LDPVFGESWETLVNETIIASEKSNTPTNPPKDRVLNSGELKLQENGRFAHAMGDQRLPFLGSAFSSWQSLHLSIKPNLLDEYPELSRVFIFENGNVIGVVLKDGSRKEMIFFDTTGKQLSAYPFIGRRFQVSGDYFMTKTDSFFTLYKIQDASLNLVAEITYDEVSKYLQDNSPRSKKSFVFNCSDFQFVCEDSGLKVWAFNVNTTALPPDFSHLLISTKVSRNASFSILKAFGQATIAERMPLPRYYQKSAFVEGKLWVPRRYDAHVDVFEKNGDLYGTVELNPLIDDIFPSTEVNSASFLEAVLSAEEAESLTPFLRLAPITYQVISDNKHVIIQRASTVHQALKAIFDVASADAKIAPLSFYETNFRIVGSSQEAFICLARVHPNVSRQPYWAENSGVSIEMLQRKPGFWIMFARF